MLNSGSRVRDLTIGAQLGETPRLRLYRAAGPSGSSLVAEVKGRVLDLPELQRRVDEWSEWSQSEALGVPTSLVRSGDSTLLVASFRECTPWQAARLHVADNQKLAWLGRAVDAVSALHCHRIPHGELGPESIGIAEDGMVLTFMPGVADLLEAVTGGEAWTEPEVAAGSIPTMTSDVFALGVFAADLAGQQVDLGTRRARRAVAAGRHPWPKFEPTVAGWPTEMTAVMNGALGSRAERPSSAVVLRAVLRSAARGALAQHAPMSMPAAVEPPARERRAKKKRWPRPKLRLRKVAPLLGLAAVVALAVWFTSRPYQPSCRTADDCAAGLTCEGALCRGDGMAYLPPATFEVGALEGTVTEYDQGYEVKLTYGFHIDQYEVTQDDFRELTDTSPSWSSECGGRCPVESVNWFEAVTYANLRSESVGLEPCYRLVDCVGELGEGCPELEPGTAHHECMGSYRCASVEFEGLECSGYRLPTEVEWEYAARGGTTEATYAGGVVPWGREGAMESLERLATIARTAFSSAVSFPGAWPCSEIDSMAMGEGCGPAPSGSLEPNSYGMYDVLGNVAEWSHDSWESDPARVATWRCFGEAEVQSNGERACRRRRVVDRTSHEPEADVRALRGGAWFHSAGHAIVSVRGRLRPEARFVDVGFRLVRAAVPPG